MDLDSNLLLTAERLRLDSGLIIGAKWKGTYAIKRIASRTYLRVDELQGRVLDEFTHFKTVPEVLESCIRKRTCPALRDFYDLILKAHRAGVLRSEELGAEGPAAPMQPPIRWFVPLPAALGLALALLGLLAVIGAAIVRTPVLSDESVHVVLGWSVTCAALSLGQILAACVLHAAERELRAPRVKWLSLTPHLTFDFADACLATGRERAAMQAVQLFPLAGLVAAALWYSMPWMSVPLAALFFACLPIEGGIVRELLLLLRRTPLVDTDGAPLFEPRRAFADQCRGAWRRFDRRVAGAQFAMAMLWVFALAVTMARGLHIDPTRVLADWSLWLKALPAVAIVAAAVFAGWLANALQYDIADALAASWRRWSIKWRRWLAGQPTLAASVDPESLIRRNPLLRRLPPEVQFELAQLARPLTVGPWKQIATYGQEPPYVALIVSGTVAIFRRSKSGRSQRLMRVMEGDLVGAHDLVDRDFASLEIRTGCPLQALVFDRAEFQRLVIEPLGVKVVRDYVHKHLFLQRGAPLCAEWRPAAVARFAELAVTSTHSAGGKIINFGQEIASIYVLYEGAARALRGNKPVGRIEPGDFFGETSLLQSSAATADVESKEDGRYLAVNRVEFIRFMSRNHHVALQFERLCSKRLGHPVFPLNDVA